MGFIDPIPGAFVALDFETADYRPDSACAIGLVRVERGRIVRRVRQLLRPPRDQMMFSHIHGLTLDELEDKPDFATAWPVIRDVMEGAAFLAAHNAGFDKRVLDQCCECAEVPAPELPWVCTVQQARRTLGMYPADLHSVAVSIGFKLNHHDALSDAEACARIVMLARKALSGVEG
jgi:DNA polymerase-3 subunit epsilon